MAAHILTGGDPGSAQERDFESEVQSINSVILPLAKRAKELIDFATLHLQTIGDEQSIELRHAA